MSRQAPSKTGPKGTPLTLNRSFSRLLHTESEELVISLSETLLINRIGLHLALGCSFDGSSAPRVAACTAVPMLTKFGLFDLRYYDEFAAKATPSGQYLYFGITLGGNPWGK